MENRSVLLFFIDGLGIGTRGPQNPFDDLDDAAPLAIFCLRCGAQRLRAGWASPALHDDPWSALAMPNIQKSS